MVFMIRLLFILLMLSSCGNLPITYLQNFSSVNNVVFGFPEYEITQELFDEYDNSFLKIRFGRGPHAILILAYVNDGIYEWVGADNVKIFTLNGRVIKTSGLPNNFEISKPFNSFLDTEEVFETINLYNPDLFSATLKRSLDSRNASIEKLGESIPVNRIKENFIVESIGWNGVNLYYQNIISKEIEYSEQRIHPRLPVAKIEYYFKY
tara:strand:- start:288 stop:911 length:624 start_codon:yes stop_codon:yes gene_type:complete